jgi:cytochrome c oxidase subunit 1
MASPFMNMLSYWFFFAAGIVMLSSFFVETGPFSGGWTAYPPLVLWVLHLPVLKQVWIFGL